MSGVVHVIDRLKHEMNRFSPDAALPGTDLYRDRAAHGRAVQYPPSRHLVVLDGAVLHRAVVLHQQVAAPPLMAINEARFDDVIGECGDQRLGFFLI
jgi:hypothetical protein